MFEENLVPKITFQVDTRLAKLLAENYRSSERALKELIDNGWDADAEHINISLPEPLTSDPVIVCDNLITIEIQPALAIAVA